MLSTNFDKQGNKIERFFKELFNIAHTHIYNGESNSFMDNNVAIDNLFINNLLNQQVPKQIINNDSSTNFVYIPLSDSSYITIDILHNYCISNNKYSGYSIPLRQYNYPNLEFRFLQKLKPVTDTIFSWYATDPSNSSLDNGANNL